MELEGTVSPIGGIQSNSGSQLGAGLSPGPAGRRRETFLAVETGQGGAAGGILRVEVRAAVNSPAVAQGGCLAPNVSTGGWETLGQPKRSTGQ